MSRTLKIILLSFGIALVAAYFIVTACMMHKQKKDIICRAVDICVTDSAERQFLTAHDIEKFLIAQTLYPLNLDYTQISCSKIEHALNANEIIEKADCFKTPTGTVVISLSQRKPLFRVSNGENFFVDVNRKIMPVRSTTATRVPVVTGRCTKHMATEEIFDFVTWLVHNDFWNAQIEQINVLPDKQIELVPRVGNSIILLGTLDNYEAKLDKLMTLYTQGFNVSGWTPYKEIDLRFKGQIIGRK